MDSVQAGRSVWLVWRICGQKTGDHDGVMFYSHRSGADRNDQLQNREQRFQTVDS